MGLSSVSFTAMLISKRYLISWISTSPIAWKAMNKRSLSNLITLLQSTFNAASKVIPRAREAGNYLIKILIFDWVRNLGLFSAISWGPCFPSHVKVWITINVIRSSPKTKFWLEACVEASMIQFSVEIQYIAISS